ncbi:hypothetical protein [Bacillus sp. FJAT-50079]|uniref:hypothetical protein n=1 Tax=Bacillus sp. FJAT-50079 TaxID=2833577 RepID=UPI001BC969D7|nr:hypothetical protein [Bacillus sp. FJAT-50079]MBS4206951.1 hypothetical protein [Bacillus sp. FJAT-50079]
MQAKPLQGAQELLCINTEKVYDWILEESTYSAAVGATTIALPAPIGAVICAIADSVNIRPVLTDSLGTPLPLNSEIAVVEQVPRIDRQFEINGALVTLQRVTFVKTIYVVLEISGVIPATGIPFTFTTLPIPITFTESAFLCAPPGTTLVVRVSDFEGQGVVNCDETGAFLGIGISIVVCQSIQVVTPVTLELVADFCAPRESLIETCPAPIIPPQCPVVFPGA